jgi:signal transduction histidine kinase
VGIGALFIGILDLLHTITFKGMNIFPSPIYYANQFWVATRLFESLILLTGLILVSQRILIRVKWLLLAYGLITTGIILSILVFEIFPICFIEDVGQTPFKIYSEFVIIGILIIAYTVLLRNRKYFEKDIRQLLLWSIGFAIVSEFCFTLYIQNYDFINELGHIFKILSFYMIFKANVQHGLSQPMETFFHERKMIEEKINQYNLELEKQIATKNRLFSILAHDLRNPFTVLLGYTDLLLDNSNDFSEDQKRNFLRIMNETSVETYKLLENLLTWSRAQTSDIAYSPTDFDLSAVIDECTLLVSKQAQFKDISISKEYSSVMVSADKDMIMTVIRNLLSNAVKFTPRQGTIRVSSSDENGYVRIKISDNGVGMPEEKLNSLFHVHINSSTRGTENESGIGLGLIIADEFVRINKGNLQVESKINEGSTFSFTLPVVN